MAIKKKMAGKPAMVKKKKMQEGGTTAKSDTTSKKLSEVKVRPSFGQNFRKNMVNFLDTKSSDYQNTPAKTTAGKVLRGANELASDYARIIGLPAAVATSALGAGVDSIKGAIAKRKELNAMKKNGGKVAKKVAPKMAMKKMSKKK